MLRMILFHRALFCKLAFVAILGILSLTLSASADAGWRVAPIRLDFDQRSKSGVITLSNDGESSITFSVEAAEWTQDENGLDLYTPTEDLIFFPKQLTVEPGKERVVRAGIRAPATTQERTYRLFIREAVDPAKKSEGTAVAIAIKFGVPIFARPVEEIVKGELLATLARNGELKITTENTGNAHYRIATLRFLGKDAGGGRVFTEEVNGWYLLAGARRGYSVQIPPEACLQLKTLDIKMHADRLYLEQVINVDPAMCPTR